MLIPKLDNVRTSAQGYLLQFLTQVGVGSSEFTTLGLNTLETLFLPENFDLYRERSWVVENVFQTFSLCSIFRPQK